MTGNCNVESSPSAKRKIVDFGPDLEKSLNQLTLEKILESYNLLGFDNGDGELACSRVHLNENKLLVAEPLTFGRTNAELYHVPNIIAFLDGKAKLLDAAYAEQSDSSREIYHNFKRCPGGNRTPEEYLHSSKTYGELMGHSFACAIDVLFQYNKCLDRDKPTIIMVGRPASKGWADQEQAYTELLGQNLKTYLPDAKTITILVLSESCAAMAGEIGMKQDRWLNTVIQILDLGSSTFDITTVTPKGLPEEGEDSFQFGGNQLDQAIAAKADFLYYKKYPEEEGYVADNRPGKIANLRFKKELCYGDNGVNQAEEKRSSPYTCDVRKKGLDGRTESVIDEATEDPATFSFPITRNAMGLILKNDQHGSENLKALHCTTERLKHNAFRERGEHDSWLEACRYVMNQFYEQTSVLYPDGAEAPGRLILTGGVSNMPEVQEIAKDVFRVNKGKCIFKVSDKPSLTVSNGLALVLGNELLKKTLLRELKEELKGENSLLPNAASLRKEMVDAACKSDLDYYEEVIHDWSSGSAEKTLGSCIDTICNKNNDYFHKYDNFVEKACENWFQNNKIDEIIKDAIHNKFRQMFPTVTESFHWTIEMPDMSDMPVKELDNSFIINPYMFFDENNCPQDPYDTNCLFNLQQREQIYEVYCNHREELAEGGQKTIKEHRVNIKGIKSVYEEQLTDADALPYRTAILEKLMPAIDDFVESLTYYLAMSAHV